MSSSPGYIDHLVYLVHLVHPFYFRVRVVAADNSDMKESGGRWERSNGRKENEEKHRKGGKEEKHRKGESVKKEEKHRKRESVKKEAGKRETLVALGRTNIKDENERRPKIEEKDLDTVVSRIKEKSELEQKRKERCAGFVESERSATCSRASLAEAENGKGGSAVGGWGRGSRKQEQFLAKIGRGPALVSPAPARVRDSRPKGKTIRKAHYDPREVG